MHFFLHFNIITGKFRHLYFRRLRSLIEQNNYKTWHDALWAVYGRPVLSKEENHLKNLVYREGFQVMEIAPRESSGPCIPKNFQDAKEKNSS